MKLQPPRSLVPSIASACLLLLSSVAFAAPTQMTITPDRSSITFTSTAPAERIVGTAEAPTGMLTVDLDALEATTGTLRVAVESMNTGNRMRDRHLRNADWLNAAAHPEIIFSITGLEDVQTTANGDRTDVVANAVGTITVNGVAAPTTARVEVALLNSTRTARIQPRFTVQLSAHNVSGANGAIGDTVGASIEIEGTIYAAWE